MDGHFILVGPSADNYTLEAAPEGFASTTLPIRLRSNPGGEGIEMRSTEFPVVTITAPVASCVEGRPPARFKISRTAPVGSELKVNLLKPSGTAFAQDYTLAPKFAEPVEKRVSGKSVVRLYYNV